MSRKYGYMRVSTKDQNLDRQLEEFRNEGIEDDFIFKDKQSGKDFERAEYLFLRRIINKGDTLVIKSLDRFGRNKDMILEEWRYLIKEKQAHIKVLDMPLLDTTKFKDMQGVETLITDLVLQILSWIAEDDRNRIKKNQAEGIAVAKAKGKHLGRPQISLESLTTDKKAILEDNYLLWKDKKITGVEFASRLKLKKNTFYKIIKEYEATVK